MGPRKTIKTRVAAQMIAVVPIMYQGIKYSCAFSLPVSHGILRKEVMLYNTNLHIYIALSFFHYSEKAFSFPSLMPFYSYPYKNRAKKQQFWTVLLFEGTSLISVFFLL